MLLFRTRFGGTSVNNNIYVNMLCYNTIINIFITISDAFQMNMIETAFTEYHTRTCIRFKPRTNEQDYIVLKNGNTGCWSSVGRIGGRQEVNFQTPGCMTKIGTVIHELMHACGFLHEQNRSERDSYVSINWNNVKSGKNVIDNIKITLKYQSNVWKRESKLLDKYNKKCIFKNLQSLFCVL